MLSPTLLECTDGTHAALNNIQLEPHAYEQIGLRFVYSGQDVALYELTKASGNIPLNTAGMSNGTFVLSLVIDGAVVHSEKIVIQGK